MRAQIREDIFKHFLDVRVIVVVCSVELRPRFGFQSPHIAPVFHIMAKAIPLRICLNITIAFG